MSSPHTRCTTTETWTKLGQILCAQCGLVVGAAEKKPRKPFSPSEDMESAALVRWLETQPEVKFSHLPLEVPTNPVQAARLKRIGVRKGVPDYLLVIRGRTCFIEMKKASGGRVSKEQQSWIDVLRMAGNDVYVCEGFHEAKRAVQNLLARE